MPELVQLHEDWSGKDVRVQTVAIDVVAPRGKVKTAADIQAFMEKREFAIPTLAFDGDGGKLQSELGLRGTPLTLAIDGDGKVVDRQVGAAGRERYEAMIAKALGE